jgi:hydrogenase nickel incorporation protein HypA/HybF
VHELSIAQSICEIVGQYVTPEKQHAVKSVRVLVGDLSGVVPESLRFCFGAITAGTPLERAGLTITAVPLEAECRDCRRRFTVEQLQFLCPACGGTDLAVLSGKELQVTEIELHDELAESV